MTKILIQSRIQKAFSKSALQYDRESDLQRKVACELLGKVAGANDQRKIVDLGCGNGWFTGELKKKFPASKIYGLDFAPGMIALALKKNPDLKMLQAEAAALPFKNNSLDELYSNLMYQWIFQMNEAFKAAHRVLKKNGTLVFSTFGSQTLRELFLALEETSDHWDGTPAFWPRKFLDAQEIARHLSLNGFKNVEVDFKVYRESYKDLYQVLLWLKVIGANTRFQNFFLGKDHLLRASVYCLENLYEDGRLPVTFDVIFVKAQK